MSVIAQRGIAGDSGVGCPVDLILSAAGAEMLFPAALASVEKS
jgi:hypothetical protein